ncbi:MAG: helix-turn-helix domain-containing protein [Chitinivibrionales bacterium]|nr:helix-turn-helix domain-containing protein [Chitinivibrionales bacterium]MBD3394602.1 helix-turn-helix domain-containing protein [Chitinivibrionales bacterium]
MNRHSLPEPFTRLPQIYFVEYLVWEKSRQIEAHAHDGVFQLDYFPQGAGTYSVDGATIEIDANTFFFVAPSQRHEIHGSSENPLENATVKFGHPGIDTDGFLPHVCRVHADVASRAGTLFRQVISEAVLKQQEHMAIASLRLAELLLLLRRSTEVDGVAVPDSRPVTAARRYMLEHFADDISIGDVAGSAGTTPEHLCRVFKKETGDTPFTFLRGVRVERAKKHLESTRDNIAAIAQATGFGQAKNINRIFKNLVGMTPREYRRKALVENRQ